MLNTNFHIIRRILTGSLILGFCFAASGCSESSYYHTRQSEYQKAKNGNELVVTPPSTTDKINNANNIPPASGKANLSAPPPPPRSSVDSDSTTQSSSGSKINPYDNEEAAEVSVED